MKVNSLKSKVEVNIKEFGYTDANTIINVSMLGDDRIVELINSGYFLINATGEPVAEVLETPESEVDEIDKADSFIDKY